MVISSYLLLWSLNWLRFFHLSSRGTFLGTYHLQIFCFTANMASVKITYSIGDLLAAFLTESWLSSFRDLAKTLTLGLAISKALDILVPQNSPLYPSVYNFIWGFLSDHSIDAVVLLNVSTNSGVFQGSVLSLTLLILFNSSFSN